MKAILQKRGNSILRTSRILCGLNFLQWCQVFRLCRCLLLIFRESKFVGFYTTTCTKCQLTKKSHANVWKTTHCMIRAVKLDFSLFRSRFRKTFPKAKSSFFHTTSESASTGFSSCPALSDLQPRPITISFTVTVVPLISRSCTLGVVSQHLGQVVPGPLTWFAIHWQRGVEVAGIDFSWRNCWKDHCHSIWEDWSLWCQWSAALVPELLVFFEA